MYNASNRWELPVNHDVTNEHEYSDDLYKCVPKNKWIRTLGPADWTYNCFAFAISVFNEFIQGICDIEDTINLTSVHGFEKVENELIHEFDPRFERIAFMGTRERVEHGFKQWDLTKRTFASKCGALPLVEHECILDVNGIYGNKIWSTFQRSLKNDSI